MELLENFHLLSVVGSSLGEGSERGGREEGEGSERGGREEGEGSEGDGSIYLNSFI